MKLNIFILSLLSGIQLSATQSHLAKEYLELVKLLKDQDNKKAELYAQKGLELDPNNLELHQYTLMIAVNNRNFEKALHHAQFILKKRPDLGSAWSNVAYCLKSIGKTDQAIPFYDKAIELRPQHLDSIQSRAECLLKIGHYIEAWPYYENRWRPLRTDAPEFTKFLHSKGNLIGKKILLRSEFGMGDTFQFIRYAQIIKEQGGYVMVEPHKQLQQILKLCPFIDEIISAESPTPYYDYATVLISLAHSFNTTLETIPQNIPYLKADPTLTEFWRKQLFSESGGNKHNFKIGLCWNGNNYDTKLLKDLVLAKSIPLEQLIPLFNLKNARFYSLQKISGTDQIKNLPDNIILQTFGKDFDVSHGSFMDTAAVMQNLDLVITIDTSIVHLAGGLGVKTWLVLPYVADWRWLENRNDSPWYPTVRIFRQHKPGDWKSVIDQIYLELEKIISKKAKL